MTGIVRLCATVTKVWRGQALLIQLREHSLSLPITRKKRLGGPAVEPDLVGHRCWLHNLTSAVSWLRPCSQPRYHCTLPMAAPSASPPASSSAPTLAPLPAPVAATTTAAAAAAAAAEEAPPPAQVQAAPAASPPSATPAPVAAAPLPPPPPSSSLLLGLLRFETPSLAAAYKKVSVGAGATDAEGSKDAALLCALLEGDATSATFGLELLRETIASLNFRAIGARGVRVVGYWDEKETLQFVYMMCREGGVAALMSLFARASTGYIKLGIDAMESLLFVMIVVGFVVQPGESAAQDACAALVACPKFDIAAFLEAASLMLADRRSLVWREKGGFCIGWVVHAAVATCRFVATSLRKRLAGDPNDFANFTDNIRTFFSSVSLHCALAFLLVQPEDDVQDLALETICEQVHLPGFFDGELSSSTVRLVVAELAQSLVWRQGFPLLRDPDVTADASLLESREDDWAESTFLHAAGALVMTAIRMPPDRLRPLLLEDGGAFCETVLALLRGPFDIGLKSRGALLVLFTSQDPEVCTRLIISGALEEASIIVRRGMVISAPSDMPTLRVLFPRLLQWLAEHVSPHLLASAAVSDASGFGHIVALNTFANIAQSPSTLIALRQVPVMYKALEGALVDAAILTHDVAIYLRACGALSFLDISAPPFGQGAHRAAPSGALRARSRAVATWSVDEVVAWADSMPFKSVAPALRAGHVDGPTLLELGGAELADLGLATSVHVKVVLDAIDELRGTSRALAAAEAPGSPVSPRSGTGGGARSATSLQATISAAFATVAAPDARPEVFVCYRRATGSHLARLLGVYLSQAGFRPFIDVEGLVEGVFDAALEAKMRAVQHVVVVLSEGALDRCMTDSTNTDFVRKEIAMALALKKTVVPVWSNFSFPPAESLPADVRGLLKLQAVEWHHSYVDASVAQLVKFLRGADNGDTGGATARGGSAGDAAAHHDAPAIFLSYAWGAEEGPEGVRPLQARAHSVAAALRAAGLSVWLDTERMSSSAQGADGLADAMVSGVEGASAVVVCVSAEYTVSENCKAEFYYALQRKKPIFYVNVGAHDWVPASAPGWLLFKMRDALWSDARTAESARSSNGLAVLLAGLDATPAVAAHKAAVAAAATAASASATEASASDALAAGAAVNA